MCVGSRAKASTSTTRRAIRAVHRRIAEPLAVLNRARCGRGFRCRDNNHIENQACAICHIDLPVLIGPNQVGMILKHLAYEARHFQPQVRQAFRRNVYSVCNIRFGADVDVVGRHGAGTSISPASFLYSACVTGCSTVRGTIFGR
jgi:hypothetical protein